MALHYFAECTIQYTFSNCCTASCSSAMKRKIDFLSVGATHLPIHVFAFNFAFFLWPHIMLVVCLTRNGAAASLTAIQCGAYCLLHLLLDDMCDGLCRRTFTARWLLHCAYSYYYYCHFDLRPLSGKMYFI